MSALRRAGGGLAWIVALAAAVLVLHACATALPAPPWPPTSTALADWLQTRGAIGAAFSIVRLVAVVLAWYLVAVTGLTLLARLSGSRPLARLALQLTPRLARAALRPLLGAGLTVSLLGAPAPLLAVSTAHAAPWAAGPSTTPGGAVAAHVVRTDLAGLGSAPGEGGPTPTIVVTPLDEPPPPTIPGTTTADHVDEQPPPTSAPPTTLTPSTTLAPPGQMSPPDSAGAPTDTVPSSSTTAPPTGEPPSSAAPSTDAPPPTGETDEPANPLPAIDDATAIGRILADVGRRTASDLGRLIDVPDRWVIAPGDHLWHVAETTLTRSWGRAPTDAEITPYWEALIASNRDRLADPANPDLVLPGQELVLPPPPTAPPLPGS